jgi:ketosteroid isomerase-like protein
MQQNLTAEQQAVWDVIEAFNSAFADNDADRYFVHMHPDLSVITPGNPYRIEGIADDREGFEFGLKTGHSHIGYFQELQPRIDVLGETAVVTYYTRGSYGTEPNARTLYFKETDVLVKVKGVWKVFHIHVSA